MQLLYAHPHAGGLRATTSLGGQGDGPPVSRGSGHGHFLPPSWPAGVSTPLRLPPTGVSCLCSARPAPSPGDSLAGGRKCFPPPDAGAPHGTRPSAAAPACLEHLAWRQAPGDHRRPRRTQGHRRPVVSSLGACEPPGTIRPPCAGPSNGDVLTHLLFLLFFFPSFSSLLPSSPWYTISLVSLFLSASSLPLSFFSFHKYLLNTYCVPGPILGTESTIVIRTDKSLCPQGGDVVVEEINTCAVTKQLSKYICNH